MCDSPHRLLAVRRGPFSITVHLCVSAKTKHQTIIGSSARLQHWKEETHESHALTSKCASMGDLTFPDFAILCRQKAKGEEQTGNPLDEHSVVCKWGTRAQRGRGLAECTAPCFQTC